MQAPKLFDDVHPRAKPQVKGVAQNNLCAHVMQARWHHAFDGAVCADRHEYRRFNNAVVQRQAAASCERAQVSALRGIGVERFKCQHGQGFTVGQESWRRHS